MCHHAKSTKAMQDKSDQERSHQEPGSVDSRISNNGGMYLSSSSFRHTSDRKRLMRCDKIPETAVLTDRIFSNHTSVGCPFLVNPDFWFVYLVCGHR
jgi:hypothetical protein